MRVLVTGGCGFIGGHIVDKLLAKEYEVTVLDCLEQPTHQNNKPNYLAKNINFIQGNVLEADKLKQALKDVEVVFHQAATGGFTDNVAKYYEYNTLATAKFWELIVKENIKLRKFIVASSVAVYGEGKYNCQQCGVVTPCSRTKEKLERQEWELRCPACQKILYPMLTDEAKPVNPILHYSQSKYDQERITMIMGKQTKIPVVALRYFLTYGPRQSPTNPYTGVCSLFATKLLKNKKPVIYEDGLQTRDFVFVEDVADANILVMESDNADNYVFNVGTGKTTAIKHVAETIAKSLGKPLEFEIGQKYREGDVRHIVANINELQSIGFAPKFSLEQGLKLYLEWLQNHNGKEEKTNTLI